MNLVSYIKLAIKYFGIFLVSFLLFFIFLFPSSELGFLISSAVSQNSNGQVNLQFADMSLSPFPSFSGTFSDVTVVAQGKNLKAENFSFSTSLLGLIGLAMDPPNPADQKQAMTALAKNLSLSSNIEKILGGDVDFEFFPDKVDGEGVATSKVRLKVSGVSIAQALKTFEVSFPISKAKLSAESELVVDLQFKRQPDGKFKITVDNLEVPPEVVDTPAGELVLPNVKISKIVATGDIKNEVLQFTNIQVGNKKDNMYGKIKGKLNVRLSPKGVQSLRDYDFNVDLTMTGKLHEDAELLFLLVNKYKEIKPDGSVQYAFRAKGNSFQAPPRFLDYSK